VTVGREPPALVRLAGIAKDYRGLRPLRVERLEVFAGDLVGLIGFDQVSAEVFVNLLTGASLPDSGQVWIFGRHTADVSDATDWLTVVDCFGIVSARAVLLDALTPLQNLAMPFTLDVEPLRDEVRVRAEALARESGLPASVWNRPVGMLDANAQMQIRLGRALALDPGVVLLEHASAGLDASGAASLAQSVRASAAARGAAVLSLGVDEAFARAVGSRVLRWEPATGKLRERRGWFGGRLG
jgi:predicted ABC-type transport system involved in lysophospholipase L1 biosynthesis ATPase subunit